MTASAARPSVVADPQVPYARGTALLTAEQLAERWQVGRSQVYRLARENAIPTVRVGRYFRFKLSQIEAWEEAQ